MTVNRLDSPDGASKPVRADNSDDESNGRPAGLIGAVDNVLRLLRLFEDSKQIRVNEVSREMGLSRSTVHRMLSTLSHHQFVEQDEFSRAYQPGPALVDIGLAVVQNMDIRAVARGALTRLWTETNETVHLAILRGPEVLFLDSIESRQIVRTGSRVGWTLPAHATASGKALLAELDEQDLLALYPSEKLDAPTETALNSRTALFAELVETHDRGYAINNAESESDVSAVGVVVRGRAGRPRASIVVTAPRSRVDQEWVRATAAATVRIAAELSARLE
ncbi:IclR family transcriptional regulator [Nocardia colli]|uniref:IclR family transcriptional regulator n=1 Tax=Nocardia colli TaxID=2545717 RepID=UPI0035E1AAFE